MRVLGINGSLREASWNRKLLRLALGNLESKGVETSEFGLNRVPIYNADVEAEGMPRSVTALRGSVERADIVIITSPEYNGTFSSAIKNAVEWLSRAPNLMDGKLFAIMGCSPGRLGASKIHMPLSYALETEGAWVLHRPKIFVPMVDTVISEDGELLDQSTGDLIDQTMEELIKRSRMLTNEDWDEVSAMP